MKYSFLLLVFLLGACGNNDSSHTTRIPSSLYNEFQNSCRSNGGLEHVKKTGYNEYLGICGNGHKIKGTVR